ncbi:hypothetical protein NLU13_0933 [Sarocladium strictum]|uniref:F-box domain-containing protein n=1 Tax=Sarocladium strictum TaxID=5046 RepID=A0AA39GPZ7_SARSR|nr:hypothetical protein NLU13_0933 [Sarocladium strictum]
MPRDASGTHFAPGVVHSLSNSRPRQSASLMVLPTELHIAISKYLSYPDALALKHTNRHFYGFVDTGIKVKVAWLVHRRRLLLPCPSHEASCDLRSDSGFCSGNVSRLIRQRREHLECESRRDLGCIVFETAICTRRPSSWQRWRHKLRTKVVLELWLLSLVVVPLVCAWAWIMELVGSAGRSTETGRHQQDHAASTWSMQLTLET